MKKFLGILICLLTFDVFAQNQPTELFDINDESNFGESTEQIFTGKPIILIDQQRLPEVEVNKAEKLPPPDLRGNILNMPIKTLWGHDRTAAFINHTTDFLVIVQVLDSQTIRVTEQIQFVTTDDQNYFKRTFPKGIYDSKGQFIPISMEFLSFKYDNAPMPFTVNDTNSEIEVVYEKPLVKGVHKVALTYLFNNQIKTDKSLAYGFLPITGTGWKQMTERFTVLLMMPQKTHFYEKGLLFGTNNQKIPEHVKITEDIKGTLIFQSTRPLPANADVRLHFISDAKDIPQAPRKADPDMVIFGIFTIILVGYIGLSILTARYKKWRRPLKESKKINLSLWMIEVNENSDILQSKSINKTFWERHIMIGKIAAFLRFNLEYIIGGILLILSTKYMARHYGIEISQIIYIFLCLITALGVLFIDYYGTKEQMKLLKNNLKNALINEPQGLNLAKREIPTYYQIAVCFGFHEIWKKRLIANNPSYKDLTCFEKEK
ncbi:MAG: DUF2207 domain-containing protein [Pseudomonadota bacterium]|nr:DUF2207 domain-containing protein [Pseudomonadota bacterium]